MPTIKDVAQLARVSVTTVSRVLNADPAVATDTRERIQRAIAALDYRPSSLARGLRTAATRTVGVILPDVTNPFFANVLRGVEQVAWEQGYQLLIGDTGNDPHRQLTYLDLLAGKQADGALILGARGDGRPLADLARKLPIVLACEYLDGDLLPSVAIDNIAAAFDATDHLIRLGHRRVGFINGPAEIILCRDRLRGYQLAMRQLGLSDTAGLMDSGCFDIPSGREAALRLLTKPDRPTAIFCGNDEMAIGAIQAARSLGLRVPSDLSVVGFDNITMAEVVEPALTTIAQPMGDLGRRAMELLLDAMRGEQRSERIVLPHRIVIRQSCGALGGDGQR
jgi:LacI family repressor for deo operon, udp, cdd, tsx, nupC, and nupG